MEQDNQILPEALKPVLEQVAAPTPDVGLSPVEVEARQQQYGLNEIAEKKSHPILKFLRFFWGPIPVMIEAAAVIAAVIQRWDDFYIIIAMLLLNWQLALLIILSSVAPLIVNTLFAGPLRKIGQQVQEHLGGV